jgi:hypothetical protein
MTGRGPNRHFTIDVDIATFACLVVICELGSLESVSCRPLFYALCYSGSVESA